MSSILIIRYKDVQDNFNGILRIKSVELKLQIEVETYIVCDSYDDRDEAKHDIAWSKEHA